MKAQLALALLALGPLKNGPMKAPPSPARPDPPGAQAKDARDAIALLAREWLAKR